MNETKGRKKQLIGTSSWLIPGTYYENARLVAQLLDFVELLVYKWDESTKQIFDDEIPMLDSLTNIHNLYYTVHLPTDDLNEAIEAVKYFNKSGLQIINYVIHPFDDDKFVDFIETNKNISVENLCDKVYEHSRNVFDVGHYFLGKKVSMSFIENSVELHLMGVKNNHDHLQLDEPTMNNIYKIVGDKIFNFPMICFEVFNIEYLYNSINVWNNWKAKYVMNNIAEKQ